MKTKKYGLFINASRCIDCKACMIACKVENKIPPGFWRNWVKHTGGLTGKRTHFQPGQCMQCDEPSCVAACPVKASHKQADGVVVIDANKCIGCGNCVTACPYGARYRHPNLRIADKCDFCRQRRQGGEKPACVTTCPTRARIFGDLNDPQSEISKRIKNNHVIQVINSRINTKPNIFYMAGTRPLSWPKEPTLPGNVYMPAGFWKSS